MSHSDIIIIVVTLTISSTLGVYAAIRVINRHTRLPVNTLTRTGDMELVDYIEPSTNYPDLLQPQQIYYYDRVPSMPPSYHTVDRWNINSCLENAINLEFISWLILFFMLMLLIRKLLIIYY